MKLNYLFLMMLPVLYVCVWTLACPTAYAGTCTESTDLGTWTLSREADKDSDVQQKVTPANVSQTVSTTRNFGIDVTNRNVYHTAIGLRTIASDDEEINLNFTDENGSPTTAHYVGIIHWKYYRMIYNARKKSQGKDEKTG